MSISRSQPSNIPSTQPSSQMTAREADEAALPITRSKKPKLAHSLLISIASGTDAANTANVASAATAKSLLDINQLELRTLPIAKGKAREFIARTLKALRKHQKHPKTPADKAILHKQTSLFEIFIVEFLRIIKDEHSNNGKFPTQKITPELYKEKGTYLLLNTIGTYCKGGAALSGSKGIGGRILEQVEKNKKRLSREAELSSLSCKSCKCLILIKS